MTERTMHTALAAEDLAARLRTLGEQIEALEAERDRLRELGTIAASEHWRAGKYLYLIHPTDRAGNRKREYVGADPAKIEAARAALQRHHDAEAIKRKLVDLAERENRARYCIAQALYALPALATDEIGAVVTARAPSRNNDVPNTGNLW